MEHVPAVVIRPRLGAKSRSCWKVFVVVRVVDDNAKKAIINPWNNNLFRGSDSVAPFAEPVATFAGSVVK
jgi:hypothetical protein